VKLLTGHQAQLRAFIVSLSSGSPEVDDILQETNKGPRAVKPITAMKKVLFPTYDTLRLYH